jgi:enamine deaminase RidA (YjgF/YER057c/UK114 family)
VATTSPRRPGTHCFASRRRCAESARRCDVVRTRIFVTDITKWQEVAAVHAEAFGDIKPVATMVEVSALIDPALQVEIEAGAYASQS